MKALLGFGLAALVGGGVLAQPSGVQCKINGQPLPVNDIVADANVSPSGERGGFSNSVSLFRLMTMQFGDGPSSGLELKTDDVDTVSERPVSTRSLWRSSVRWQDKELKVSEGKFSFKRWTPSWPKGRAAGSVWFLAEGLKGECQFDVEMKVVDRDRLKALLQP